MPGCSGLTFNAGSLQLSLLVFCVLQLLLSATAYDYGGSPMSMRAARRGFGFKQYGLQTARGFGKRGNGVEGSDGVRNAADLRYSGDEGLVFGSRYGEQPAYRNLPPTLKELNSRNIWEQPSPELGNINVNEDYHAGGRVPGR